MSQNLTNQYIVDTYGGILHSETTLPNTGVTPMYDGMGNRSDISLGKFGQGVSVHSTLSANNIKVGALNLPNTATTTGNFMVATGPNTLALQPVSTAFPDTGVSSGDYPLGDTRNISVDSKGRVTSIEKITGPALAKDMGRLRCQGSPSVYTYSAFELEEETWYQLIFPVDSGNREDRTYKAGIFYIERSSTGQPTLTPGSDLVNIKASLNPVWETGSSATYDPNGNHCLKADSGRLFGTQFFSSLSAHPSENSVVLYIKDRGATSSQWDISLQAVYY